MRLQDRFNATLRKSGYILMLFSIFTLVACGGGSGSKSDGGNGVGGGTPQQKKLVADVANIMKASFAKLNGSTVLLDARVVAYCDALGANDEQSKRVAAQEAFKAAMNDLQRSLLHSVGPSLDEDRMLQLYSWPLSSPCKIDAKLANNVSTLNSAVDRRGMDALEYLLFVEPTNNHSCPSTTAALDAFNGLSVVDKQARRCEFMMPVAADVKASAKILANAWDDSKGNYASTLTGSSNAKVTLNKVTDAMFYFEEILKENKFDAPLGGAVTNAISSCGIGNLCPQAVESPHARISKENIHANMLALQALYKAGFDDWLKAEGKDALAKSFGDDIQAVIDGTNSINGDFYGAISNDTVSMNNLLNGPVQDVSNALRFNVMPALVLKLPEGSASDTD